MFRNRSRHATFFSYHSIAPSGPRYLTVGPDLFERQLAHFARRGLRTGGLEELAAMADGRDPGPRLFLGFDDGFVDNYETVLPLLRRYRAKAFVFILPPVVDCGGPLAWPEIIDALEAPGSPSRSITWEMAGEMKEGGFEVGSHTLTHPFLSKLDDESLRHELWESRARIAERLGSCDTIAYPFGDWSPRVANAARECGYRFAFTQPTKIGQRQATPHSIPRINIDYRDQGPRLDLKLSAFGRRLLLSPPLTVGRRRVEAWLRTATSS